MSKTRLSIDIDDNEHKYLKMCCAKLGVSIKEFVLNATIATVDDWECKWLADKWEKDGTLEELKRESENPDRITYRMEKVKNKFFFTEMCRGKAIGVPFEI